MPRFHVLVRRNTSLSDVSLPDFTQEVTSQNSTYAAACGLSLAGGGFADLIEVQALQPVPGRPVGTRFQQCSQGLYGFCFTQRSLLN